MMTRDQALIIAKRLMRRIEDDQAIHLDSLADELVLASAVSPWRPTQAGYVCNVTEAYKSADWNWHRKAVVSR